jgi:glycosyltransferase involved in cell wall biosynthesis
MLTDGLARRGHRVHLALALEDHEPEHPLVVALDDSPVNVVLLTRPARAYLREARLIAKLCDSLRPDIVHTHGYRSDIVSLIATRGRSVGRVTTVHGFTGGDTKNKLYERLQKVAHRGFDAVIAVSEPLAQALRGRSRSSNVRFLPNAWGGPTDTVVRDRARQMLGLPPDEYMVGWVGRLTREKAPDIFLEAASRLRGKPIHFAVLGNGAEKGRLVGLAEELGLGEQLHWVDSIDRAGRFFQAFDVFVLSSRTEGTPIVLFEAMAAGVPIVATAVGGVPDVVSGTEAWLVPAGDPDRIAKAILECREHADVARQRANAAAQRLETDFKATSWLAQHEAIYERVLTEKRARERG